MFCTKCGKEINEDWKACPYCGADNEMLVKNDDVENKENERQLSFDVMAVRRTGKFGSKKLVSAIDMDGDSF